MINLLPDDQKRDITAARANVILLRYNILLAAGAAVLFALCFAFYFMLQLNHSSAVATTSNNSAKAATYESIRKQADDYRNNLILAGTILDSSFNYTPVIFSITKLLPDGVVLDGINLSTNDFGQQTNFTAHSKTFAQASQLKQNFQSSTLFSNVYFQSLTDERATSPDGGSDDKPYPIAITISAKINKDKAGN